MIKNILLTLTLLTSLAFGSSLTSSQASSHIGEYATVCGKVVRGYHALLRDGEPTFLNLGREYPNQQFTIVIWGDDRDQFNKPETKYTGKMVCVIGFIDSVRGIPQIVVESPLQVR